MNRCKIEIWVPHQSGLRGSIDDFTESPTLTKAIVIADSKASSRNVIMIRDRDRVLVRPWNGQWEAFETWDSDEFESRMGELAEEAQKKLRKNPIPPEDPAKMVKVSRVERETRTGENKFFVEVRGPRRSPIEIKEFSSKRTAFEFARTQVGPRHIVLIDHWVNMDSEEPVHVGWISKDGGEFEVF